MEHRPHRFRGTALAAAVVLATLGAGNAAAAPVQWGVNGHSYEYIEATNIIWTDANDAATGLGAGWNLASITSADEKAFVLSLIAGTLAARTHVWIGGSDAAAEGSWTWTNGDAFALPYTDWWPDEPNNTGGIENYLALDLRNGSWAWNDAPNDVHTVHNVPVSGYIVENPVPIPAAAWLLGSALLGIAGVARRRKT
jgi:hypothetical protein